MTDIKIGWERWHPKSPVKSIEEEIDAFYDLYPAPYKKFNDPTTVKGDIIEDYQRNIRVKLNRYRCPICNVNFSLFEEANEHANRFLNGTDDHPAMKPEDMEEIEFQEHLAAALVYYEIVRPEEIIPYVPSVERSFRSPGPIPIVAQREAHDKQAGSWRKQMETTAGQRNFHIEMMPGGDIQEKGAGGKWWYWCPQEFHNGSWISLSPEELGTIGQTKQQVRVLCILAIIPADLQVSRPVIETEQGTEPSEDVS